jgi:hypothetical protein
MTILLIIASVLIFVGGPLGWVWWANRTKPGATNMVHVDSAAGEIEAKMWQEALRSAGIKSRVRNTGDFRPYGQAAFPYQLWVRAKDERRARQVLGL